MYTDIQRIGELSKDGVFVYNLVTGKYDYINTPFADLFDATIEQMLREPRLVLPYIRSEDAYFLRHRYSEFLKTKTISGIEFRVQLKNGNIRHLCCDAYLMDDDSLVTGFIKDITRSKEHEDYIIDYGARKDTLLDMMTHNLSGPLALSQNILRWMQETYKDKTPGDISSQLLLIQENTQQCVDIVNDFLKEEHLESQRIYVKKTRFDIIERITITLEKLILTNKNKKFRLVTKLKNLNITTDSVKFFQSIHNLVSNAIKFTPENGEIDILVEETERTFIVRVKDNGIGIPPELHGKLFEKRTPSGRDGLNREVSTGLGLYIVRALVHLMGGTVDFETEVNKGSVFSIELPKDDH